MAVFVSSALVLLIVISILSVLIFSKQRVIKSRTRKFSLAKFSIFKGRTTNLFLQECYKVFIGGKALLILIAFAVITAVSYSPISESCQQTRFITSSICLNLRANTLPKNRK